MKAMLDFIMKTEKMTMRKQTNPLYYTNLLSLRIAESKSDASKYHLNHPHLLADCNE